MENFLNVGLEKLKRKKNKMEQLKEIKVKKKYKNLRGRQQIINKIPPRVHDFLFSRKGRLWEDKLITKNTLWNVIEYYLKNNRFEKEFNKWLVYEGVKDEPKEAIKEKLFGEDLIEKELTEEVEQQDDRIYPEGLYKTD